ncbi:ribosomal large subunit pseudouridine synthase D [Melghirimyces profundicolus]|uniref:Pseudouridine synthase n=1 Tax=Melghirimyces profundicolus TaxID=1242148 RepID=A0A2T6B793_9BACL|nr:RluA family pseudouridine synthase [Melghirimyces profundicolus]PTX51937.1 ribosomal large subunit pseudouridine synthase D [Melghirimyces profundicolus]
MSSEENRRFEVDESGHGERVDKFLASKEEDWSRMAVQSWIREARVRVDGRPVKSNYRLKAGERVEVTVPPPEEPKVEPEPIPLDVVYEDDNVIVVNKPRGMVVHPAPGTPSGTLVNALLAHCKDLSGIGGVLRPGIVHRIDKDTSGLLMAAKNDRAHQSLAAQLKAHEVDRMYVALVNGSLPHDKGTIDAPIGRDPRDRKRMAVEPRNGKPAVTHFEVVERFRRATLVQCRLETGRTHQIRVHMKYIGHPLVGDPVYSTNYRKFQIEGQALHARVLGFQHPATGERIRLEAELPEDMQRLIRGFRKHL